jgi:hypothetical protein
MNFQGIVIGGAAFLIIGVFHPIVIKAEYRFGTKAWPAFLVLGLLSTGFSTLMKGATLSAILGVLGFASLWSIRELFEQEIRVQKGWFPSNPKRDK